MSKTSIDIITRSALWAAYNKLCFYCTRPLDWGDLHIDHVIPEYFDTQKENFEKIKKEFGLNTNFDLNGLYNLVPTHSKCNTRKNKELFSKQATHFYLGLTDKKAKKIKSEIAKLLKNKNRSLVLSKLQLALETKIINRKELENLIEKSKHDDWNSIEIKLPPEIEFIDEAYNSFYHYKDCSTLYDKKLLLGGDFESLELINPDEETINVSTLREWQDARNKGFYPYSTVAIKISSSFTFLEGFLEALHNSKMPKVSFLNDPSIDISNIEFLSPAILKDFEGYFAKCAKKGLTIGDLVKKGKINIIEKGINRIVLQYDGMETSLTEHFRADFNDDGIEDIFVNGWTRAIEGTLGYGFTMQLTKYSSKSLIEELVPN